MFEQYFLLGDEIHIFIKRIPRRSGDNPTTNRLILASFVAVCLVAVLIDMSGDLLAPYARQSGLVRKAVCYAALLGLLVVHIVRQFERLVFSPADKTICRWILGIRFFVARFDDIAEVRTREEEVDGVMYYRFIGVWAADKLKKPLELSPWGVTPNQLNRYRRSIIPRVQAALQGETFEESYAENVEVYFAGIRHDGERKPEAAPKPDPHDRMRSAEGPPPEKGVATRLGSRETKHIVLPLAAAFFRLAALGSLVYFADVGEDAHFAYNLAAVAPFVLQYPFYAYLAYRMWRACVAAAEKNVSVVIDPRGGLVTVRLLFGLVSRSITFDSLIKVIVKDRLGMKFVCLSFDDQPCDAVVFACWSTDDAWKRVRDVCAAMRLVPGEWVDVLYRLPDYSELYRKYPNLNTNPYRYVKKKVWD